jgi:hypothetical protein
VEIQARVQVFLVEAIDGLSVLRGSVTTPHVLASDRTVVGLYQPVAVRVPLPRFGLFDQQFVQ